jgi:hypothetical protein
MTVSYNVLACGWNHLMVAALSSSLGLEYKKNISFFSVVTVLLTTNYLC